MSDPVCLQVPFEGSSREARLMSALEFLVWYAPDYPLPNCRIGEESEEEVSRAVAWLASKYVFKAAP